MRRQQASGQPCALFPICLVLCFPVLRSIPRNDFRLMVDTDAQLETIRHVAILYQPFMPNSAAKLLDQLGIPEGEARRFSALGPRGPYAVESGKALQKPVPVFPRIESEEEAAAPAAA